MPGESPMMKKLTPERWIIARKEKAKLWLIPGEGVFLTMHDSDMVFVRVGDLPAFKVIRKQLKKDGWKLGVN